MHSPAPATHFEDTLEQTATSNAATEVLHLSARLVDIEGSNHDQLGLRLEVAHRSRNLGGDVLDQRVDVVAQLSRDGDDRGAASDGAVDEAKDGLMVLLCDLFADQVDLVLDILMLRVSADDAERERSLLGER